MKRFAIHMTLYLLTLQVVSCQVEQKIEYPAKDAWAFQQSFSLRGQGVENLTFAVYEYLPHELMIEHLKPLINYISHKLEVPVSLVLIREYKEIERLAMSGEADIALLPPLIYVMVREKINDVKPLVSRIGKEIAKYSSYIVVRKESDINRLEDLRGKKIAFVDERSTSGFLFPLISLLENGVEPEKFFSKMIFSGDHIKSLQMLYNREVEAAATYSGGIRAARLSGVKTGAFKILMKTGRIPNDVLCSLKKLDSEVEAKIRNLFLTISSRNKETQDILHHDLEINGWSMAEDSNYDPVRENLKRYREWKKKAGKE